LLTQTDYVSLLATALFPQVRVLLLRRQAGSRRSRIATDPSSNPVSPTSRTFPAGYGPHRPPSSEPSASLWRPRFVGFSPADCRVAALAAVVLATLMSVPVAASTDHAGPEPVSVLRPGPAAPSPNPVPSPQERQHERVPAATLRPQLSCFPIPSIRPLEPGPVPMPRVGDRVLPVPMPRPAVPCEDEGREVPPRPRAERGG
jgi:hypothetical protein